MSRSQHAGLATVLLEIAASVVFVALGLTQCSPVGPQTLCSTSPDQSRVDASARPSSPAGVGVGVRFRAIYLDLDGTALGPDHQPRPGTINALMRYRRCGGRVGIATGRSPEEVRPYLVALRPDLPLVVFNGAGTVDAAATRFLRVTKLPRAALDSALATVADEPDIEAVILHFVREAVEKVSVRELRAYLSKLPSGSVDFVKLVLIVHGERRNALGALLRRTLPGGARAVVSSPTTVEVVPSQANKFLAIRNVLADEGLGLGDVLVFGDSPNDSEMLRGVPASVVMGNCHPDVCEAALFRAGDNGTDAIAKTVLSIAIGPSCSLR